MKCRSLFPELWNTISLSARGSKAPLKGLSFLLAPLIKKESTPNSEQKPRTISEESL